MHDTTTDAGLPGLGDASRQFELLLNSVTDYAIIDDTRYLYVRCAGEGVEVRWALPPSLPCVDVDRAQLEAALLNLVGNSRDAMPAGGTITISTRFENTRMPDRPDDPDTGFVCVSVADTGTGISEDIQGRVFEPFFTTKDVGRRSGLGLSQVFGFAALCGGFATLESAPGEGTCVAVHLPVPEPA